MKKDPLKIQTHFILGFLILQYLFGMVDSLFIQFPQTQNESSLWTYAKEQPAIIIHMIIALLLVIGAIVHLIRSIRRKERYWIISSSIGLAGILIASFGGVQFVATQQDGYSYVMAAAFIITFVAYGWGLYKNNVIKIKSTSKL